MNNSIDQQFVEYVVKSLVSKPEAVSIERRIDEKGVLLELTVDPEDLGRVIGKRGATAQSLRTLLRALGTKNDARYNLKIMDKGVFPHQHSDSQQGDSGSTDSSSDDSSDDYRTNEPGPVAEPTTTPDEETTEAPADDAAEDIVENSEDKANHSDDMVSKTRKELEDLDDLDV